MTNTNSSMASASVILLHANINIRQTINSELEIVMQETDLVKLS